MTKKRKKKKIHHAVHDYFLPHRRNGYQPGVFAYGSVAMILAGLLFAMSSYVGHATFASKNGFFASVVPAVLTMLTNQDRVANSLDQLIEDPLLAQAAQLKADDMAAKGYFSHQSPDGKTPWYWLEQVGYKYVYAGENLAIDFFDTQDVEEAWMASPTHRANIVKPQYTHIGIGVAQGLYQGRTTTFVVQVFASPAKAAAAPAAAPVAAAVTPKPAPNEGLPADRQVLGAVNDPAPAEVAKASEQTTPAAPQATPEVPLIEQIAASPSHALTYFLIALFTLVACLFAVMLAIHAHLRKIAVEMIGGGVLLTGTVAACLLYVTADPNVLLPDDQAASVSQAL